MVDHACLLERLRDVKLFFVLLLDEIISNEHIWKDIPFRMLSEKVYRHSNGPVPRVEKQMCSQRLR